MRKRDLLWPLAALFVISTLAFLATLLVQFAEVTR